MAKPSFVFNKPWRPIQDVPWHIGHGDALVTLVPDAGHLNHVATTHIVATMPPLWRAIVPPPHRVRCQVLSVSQLHFQICGALFLGQVTPATEAAQALMKSQSGTRSVATPGRLVGGLCAHETTRVDSVWDMGGNLGTRLACQCRALLFYHGRDAFCPYHRTGQYRSNFPSPTGMRLV